MDEINCVECGSPTGSAEKEWDFQQYRVKLCHCSKCGKTIQGYYRDGELAYTIPKGDTHED